MYNINQHRYSESTKYITKIDIDQNYKTVISSGNTMGFLDKYISIQNNGTFVSNNSYYLKFKIKKREDSDQNIHLKLQHSDASNKNEQILKKYTILSTTEEEESYDFFEIIFFPNTEYDQITWQLQRIGNDYITTDNEVIELYGTQNSGRIVDIIEIELYRIENIINNIELTKIGIQGSPSLLMCINGQQIRLGRNGIYEINGGIPINFVGFVPNGSYFFMDYEYED